ncbi:MAG TPA: glutamate-5-semialdehyde dehydrogenase [Lacibacter sp.]|nr:glutamate-5-semialdehyde dehydrogenase [Lacibacter sp.]HMO87755.1 glutamate-5-semialdehyde dehydrogenase [Lacibacter sp.]HMP85683.1 glutamate-5-semialdehyde dehydrogenase [Lacibacter sp.]
MNAIQKQIQRTHHSAILLQQAKQSVIKRMILDFAGALVQSTATILAANKKDLAKMDVQNPLYDRLLLTPERLQSISKGIKKVAKLNDPAGIIEEEKTLPNGILLQRMTVPLGVVAAIFESRPNVVADIATLCLKSRNACVLKGSRDANHTNKALVKLLHSVLQRYQLPKELVLLLPPQREVVEELFTATKWIDVIIPRGSNSLIQFVRKNSLVPVIETGAGVCHVYVHGQADLLMAARIVVNAKTSRPSVCNAMDTILIDETIAPQFLALLSPVFREKQVQLYADAKSFSLLRSYPHLHKAATEDYDREFLSLACAVKLVKNEEEALRHIAEHGTKHSEAIATANKKAAERFLQRVDAAAVYHNASTRFTDGEEFGLGAEVGISTQKLHARGPFALEKLVTEKWVARGNGQVR